MHTWVLKACVYTYSLTGLFENIWQSVKGAKDCMEYLSRKQHYTLLDMLVTQYILNEGILMRQHHDTAAEYQVEVESDKGLGINTDQQLSSESA